MQLSPDGRWYWDGAQWRPAYSPDRAWRWDGERWVPASAQRLDQGPPPVQRWRYEPTEWTRRLQVILIVVLVAGLVLSIALVPAMMTSIVQQSIDRAIANQPQDASVDPQQFRDLMTRFMYGSMAVAGILGLGWLAVILVGIVKLWRWVYWYLLVSMLLSLLSLPSNVIYALGIGPVRLPEWWLLYVIPASLLEASLGLWMLVLYRRYGNWARRRLPE